MADLIDRRQTISVCLSATEIKKLTDMAKWKGIKPSRLIAEWIEHAHQECAALWGGPVPPSEEHIASSALNA